MLSKRLGWRTEDGVGVEGGVKAGETSDCGTVCRLLEGVSDEWKSDKSDVLLLSMAHCELDCEGCLGCRGIFRAVR